MRTLIFLFCTTIFALNSNNIISQNSKIKIKEDKILTVDEVFDLIMEQTDYKFFYEEGIFKGYPKVEVSKGTIKINKLLDQSLSLSNLKITVTDNNNIVIKEKPRSIIANQQKHSVTGVINDISGQPLIGANILEKGTTNGTQTDFDGRFSIEVENANVTLIVSYLGYSTQEIELNSQTSLEIILQEDASSLDEVVIVGYGTQKKVNLTGAVGTIKGEALENKPVVNVQELLIGKVPGLNISNNSGQPGSGATLNVRGTSTIGGSSGVLVIVDGVPGNIFTINPNDIENISVLKDAASAAIYGARAANGVILVTTKKAKGNQALRVDLTTSIGVQNPQHRIDFVGAKDFMNLYNLARRNDGATDDFYGSDDFAALENGLLPNHQWNRELFKRGELIQNNYLAFSGNSDRFSYRTAIGYDKQSGSLPRDKYKRLVVHPKFTYKITDWISLDANIQYTKTNIERPEDAGTQISNSQRISPITPIFTPAGNYWGPGGVPGANPIARINQGGLDTQEFKELSTILTATITPVKNWNIIPLYSHYNTQRYTHNYDKPITLYNDDETIFSQGVLNNVNLQNAFSNSSTEILQLSTDYSLTLGDDHEFKFFGVVSQEVKKGNDFSASRLNPAFENIYVLDVGLGVKDNSGFAYNESLASVAGRLNYNYKGKYLFEAVVRHDGSSRFLDGHQWGTYPGFSAGWNVAEENFMKDKLDFISQFKIRGSWGQLGDALKISRYETRNILNFNAGLYGFNGNLVGGATADASFIPSLSWERSTKTNLGLDIGLFKNKITMSVDVFRDLRDQILYREPIEVENGVTAPFTNTLEMENKGFEFIINYRETLGDFGFNVDFNVAHSKNEVLNLRGSGPWIDGSRYTEVGGSLELPYGLQSDGLFQSQDDIDNSATQINVKPGNIKYVDQLTVDTNNDGIPDEADGVINGDDRVILNDKNAFVYGFNLGFNYKNLSLTANFYGRNNVKRYINNYEGWAFFLSNNARPMHLDSWTENNLDATHPRISLNTTSNDTQYSDYWLRKANYLKLQSLSLAYKLPKELIDVLNIDNATVSLIGQNLAMFTKYPGFDPEGGGYPLPRTITMSLQLNF
ncbi:SusC/RagA family TonB-linked outer membrane protein [Wocania ichthyoenteri]|uniref:SusC/RagA family TonB-linked outer membrane protein n=1 Tax=Wocania ichthyoenteri TaxID=1230531 RepID=UPI000690B18B|nr:TonB-dependent receptor [Wocania ichthyoenteri]